MAKLSANGNEIARYEVRTATGTEYRVSLRDTGAILRQARIIGRWEGWKKWMTPAEKVEPEALEHWLRRRLGETTRVA